MLICSNILVTNQSSLNKCIIYYLNSSESWAQESFVYLISMVSFCKHQISCTSLFDINQYFSTENNCIFSLFHYKFMCSMTQKKKSVSTLKSFWP